jgi:hypothetical protein
VVLSGTVTLQGLSASASPQDVAFTFVPTSGSSTLVTAGVDATGSVSIGGVAPGSYTVHVKGAKWLAKDVQVTVASGSSSAVDVTLLAGDVNGDNVVDLSDFSELAGAFGSDAGTANWDSNADLNCDGVVDVTDFSLLAANFGNQGDP